VSSALLERYDDRIAGVLSCYDRVVITGTLPTVCYADGMTKFLNASHVRIFDYPRFAEPLRELVRERAAALAAAAGVSIEHIGLVHVISAMEGCDTYKPWHDKQTGKTYLRPDKGQCLHYSFYFMDADLGLTYLRVPTWAPFRLQFYCNGHSRPAQQRNGSSGRLSFRLWFDRIFLCRNWQESGHKGLRFSPDTAVEKWPLRGSSATSRPCHWPMCPR